MAQMPKYMVTMPPGAPIPGIGFVRPGEFFTAPSEKSIPSRTFRPVNQEAVAPLAKIHERVVAEAEERVKAAEKSLRPELVGEMKALLEKAKAAQKAAATIVEIPHEEAKVEPGLSLKQLAEQNSGKKPDDVKPADRKL